MSSRTPIPASRRGRLKPTRVLRINVRGTKEFNRAVAQRLIRDIHAGKTDWPVDTGLSRRSFYYRGLTRGGFVVWNRANYAGYVEARTRAIQRYWRRRGRSIIVATVKATPKDERPKRRPVGRVKSFVNGLAAYQRDWGKRKDEE